MKEPIRNITSALKSINDVGYTHNDIQPCNVYLHRHRNDGTYSVKLSGFSKCQPIATQEFNSLNTASYELEEQNPLTKAPEVLLTGGVRTSTASDVWSLGVMIYALGCGRLPFRTVAQVLDSPLSWTPYKTAGVQLSGSFKHLVT